MIGHSKGVSRASALRREFQRKFREVGFAGILKLGARKLIREMCKLASLKKQNLDPFDLKYDYTAKSLS